MFILPLLGILLGIESFLVFNRVTASYGESLRESYTILAVSSKQLTAQDMHRVDIHIKSIDRINKEPIVEQIVGGIPNVSTQEVLEALPYFYTLKLDKYLSNQEIAKIKKALLAHPAISRVETFGQAHNANYHLYMLIKVTMWIFVGFTVFTSLLLVLKQMEIWQLAHSERMRVMEILGASAMLRSGVLLRMAFVDALLATLTTIGLFAFLKYYWVPKSDIDLLIENQILLFEPRDIGILSGVVVSIVIFSIVMVVRGARESIEV